VGAVFNRDSLGLTYTDNLPPPGSHQELTSTVSAFKPPSFRAFNTMNYELSAMNSSFCPLTSVV
jgi:hypothetical protein